MSVKLQLEKARQHIELKEYNKAREILQKIDHPTASLWLKKLENLDQKQITKEVSKKDFIKIISLFTNIVLFLIIIFLLINPSNSSSYPNNQTGNVTNTLPAITLTIEIPDTTAFEPSDEIIAEVLADDPTQIITNIGKEQCELQPGDAAVGIEQRWLVKYDLICRSCAPGERWSIIYRYNERWLEQYLGPYSNSSGGCEAVIWTYQAE